MKNERLKKMFENLDEEFQLDKGIIILSDEETDKLYGGGPSTPPSPFSPCNLACFGAPS